MRIAAGCMLLVAAGCGAESGGTAASGAATASAERPGGTGSITAAASSATGAAMAVEAMGAATASTTGGATAAPPPSAGPALRWAKIWPSPTYELARDAAATPDGGLVVVGRLTGELTFGATTLRAEGGADGFVLKVDADGAPLWARRLGGGQYDESRDVAVAPDGTIVVAGDAGGRFTIGEGASAVEVGKGLEDAPLLVELTPAGEVKRARTLTGGGDALGVAPAPDGGLVVAGWDLQAGACPAGSAAIAGLLAADGRPRWWLCMESAGFGMASRAVIDDSGDVAVCGTFRLRLVLGGTVHWAVAPDLFYVASAPDQAFLVKLAGADGHVLWSKVARSGGGTCQDLVALPGSFLAVAGSYAGYFDLEGVRASGNFDDGWVALFRFNGNLDWARTFSGDGADRITSVAGTAGAVLVAGYRAAGAELGGAHPAFKGSFLAALAFGDGAVVWASAFRGGDDAFVAVAPDGSLALAGYTFVASPGTRPTIDLGGGPLTPAAPADGDNGDLFTARFAAPPAPRSD